MQAKSFMKLLRKVIREEVRSALKDTLNEQKIDHKKVINHGMDLNMMSENTQVKKTFTKNTMLNDLLNETANTPSSKELADWSSTNFKSDMAESFGGAKQSQTLATTTLDGRPVNMANEKVAKTVNLMTKDYSSLMKAIDKKKGIK